MLSKLKTFAALCGAFFIAVGIAFLKGRADGEKIIEAEQQKRRDQLQEHYDEIDRQAVDPDRAYDRLRRLPDDKGGR